MTEGKTSFNSLHVYPIDPSLDCWSKVVRKREEHSETKTSHYDDSCMGDTDTAKKHRLEKLCSLAKQQVHAKGMSPAAESAGKGKALSLADISAITYLQTSEMAPANSKDDNKAEHLRVVL